MWLFTQVGFFSVVRHKDLPDQVLVRARFRDDIERLLEFMDQKGLRIEARSDADYAYRVVMPHALWVEAARRLAEDIDYTNFKDAAHSGDRVRDNALFEVWGVMRRAQDAAGRR